MTISRRRTTDRIAAIIGETLPQQQNFTALSEGLRQVLYNWEALPEAERRRWLTQLYNDHHPIPTPNLYEEKIYQELTAPHTIVARESAARKRLRAGASYDPQLPKVHPHIDYRNERTPGLKLSDIAQAKRRPSDHERDAYVQWNLENATPRSPAGEAVSTEPLQQLELGQPAPNDAVDSDFLDDLIADALPEGIEWIDPRTPAASDDEAPPSI